MCGITGWVDFDRDLTGQRDIAQAMVDTMACRGPDAEGLWIREHVALGHRRLAVIDLPGGAQPMPFSQHNEDVVALTYSGEAYNFVELRDELTANGHVFRTDSDTEVVLHAYLQWGAELVDHLNGMYAFAIWDTRREELLLVRDRMGVKPLYFAALPHGVLFGSEPKAILANGQIKPVVDADGLRETLAFVKTPGLSPYKGIREVRPGHVVRINRDGVTEHRYWGLRSEPHTDDLETTVRTVRELLDDIVTRQLISDVPLCTLLSGGLDSSAITALAQKSLVATGRPPVRSFAVDFTGQTENFQPDFMRDTPDGPYVHDLAEYAKTDHQDIVLNTADLMDERHREAVVRARDGLSMGDMDTSLYLLFKAIRERSTVALSGESADEVFGGYKWFHDRDAVRAGTFPWLAMRQRMDGGWDRLLAPRLAKKLAVADYVQHRYAEAIGEVPALDGEEPFQARMREVSYLHLTRFVQNLLDRKDRMSMAVGLEVRVPFCDHRLVQYVFNTPWSMKTFDGREKSLLRAATKDVLPESIVQRVKSPYPSTQDPTYHQALVESVEKLIAQGDSPVFDVLNADMLRAATRAPAGFEQPARMGLELALSMDKWLRIDNVEIAV
ncbi:asparagine synthase (glutamine-hydrolyzing) [Fodinicola acaciae]|uniref:asparagine synthase (glutamine-hydrolyzing) n=1 Tax=Fodinicola acaciae TaxID=2681555 RepID=UPI0013D8A101|nr:asparagine synthase (glutamine-hydrolyzing) [Fodinicola acaciae]